MTRRFSQRPRAFTLIELLVLLGVLTILFSIFVPYAMKIKEDNRRIVCRNRLQQIFKTMQTYAADNGSAMPRGLYDAAAPLQVYGVSGAFQPPANNITASLWLLVRDGKYGLTPAAFRCPGTAAWPLKTSGESNDFPTGFLSYSYASPFGQTDAYRLTDTLKPEFALMADLNPGNAGAVPRGAAAMQLANINSPNHRRAGQNVLYAYGAVEWQITPYCATNNDNIYTVRGALGSTQPASQPATDNGLTDLRILPSAMDDSFLLPAGR